jgi:hypothetical protein
MYKVNLLREKNPWIKKFIVTLNGTNNQPVDWKKFNNQKHNYSSIKENLE